VEQSSKNDILLILTAQKSRRFDSYPSSRTGLGDPPMAAAYWSCIRRVPTSIFLQIGHFRNSLSLHRLATIPEPSKDRDNESRIRSKSRARRSVGTCIVSSRSLPILRTAARASLRHRSRIECGYAPTLSRGPTHAIAPATILDSGSEKQ